VNKVIVLGLLASLAVSGPALAQAAKKPATASAYKAPRNSMGQPEFSGAWSNVSLTPQSRSPLFGTRATFNEAEVKFLEGDQDEKLAKGNAPTDVNAGAVGTEGNVGAYDRGWVDNGAKVMRVRGEARSSMITTPDGQPPLRKGSPARTLPADAGTAEAGMRAVRESAARDMFEGQGSPAAGRGDADNPEARALGERCIIGFGRNAGPPMFPNGWYNNNYNIVQSRNAVVIEVEMVHDARIVRLNDKHRTDGLRPYFGDSIGWYEGDTLVVETTNIPQRQAYNGAWENLKVTERFTRVAGDRLHYAFTLDDPTVWDKPWGGEYEMAALGGRLHEYACHEGNYGMTNILAGARQAEKENAGQRAAAGTQ